MSEGRLGAGPIRHRRRFLARCLMWVLVLILGGGGWLWWSSQHRWTVEKLERLIQAEVLPDCDRATAESWFNRHGIRYRWFEDMIPKFPELQNQNLSGILLGTIDRPQANVDLIFPGEIGVYFFFDKQDRCVGHRVDGLVYNP